jgi:UDP-glucose 4-epimerase
MRVVVTGSSGFLGRRLLPRLVRDGHEVHGVDLHPPSKPEAGASFRMDDLRQPERLVAEVGAGEDALLVHLAWNLKRDALRYREQAEQIWLLAGLLDAWCGRGLRGAIMMGSAEEYGGRAGVLAEDDPSVPPLSPYGWAKHAACEMAMAKAAATGLPLLWLRPFVVYGPGQGGDMAIPYAVRHARSGERAEFSDGLQERDFIYVDDVVEAIAAGQRRAPPGQHAVNLGTGKPVRLLDVLEGIAAQPGAHADFHYGARARRAGEPERQVADIRCARELLGWRPATDWREGIRRTCEAA